MASPFPEHSDGEEAGLAPAFSKSLRRSRVCVFPMSRKLSLLSDWSMRPPCPSPMPPEEVQRRRLQPARQGLA